MDIWRKKRLLLFLFNLDAISFIWSSPWFQRAFCIKSSAVQWSSQGSQTLFRLVYSKCSVLKRKCIQPNMMLHTLTAIFEEQSFTHLIKILPLTPTVLQDSVQDQWITALLSVSSSLGPSMAVSIFHRCLARSWPFAGTGCFVCILQLAAYCRRLGAGGRNWFIAAVKKKWKMQMNRGKVVQQLETGVGSELPLNLFEVTHPGLAALNVDMFWQATSYPGIRDTETEWERETA